MGFRVRRVIDRTRLYRFLHLLVQRVAPAGVVSVVHSRPGRQQPADDRDADPLFDTVIESDENGWTIR